MINWLTLSILTAIFTSIRDLISKHSLKNVDEYIITWSSRFFALPLLLPFLFVTETPTLGKQFLPLLGIIIIIQICASLLYFRALKLADLSAIIPLTSFIPLFLLITSPLIVGESLSFWDTLGIFLIVGGSYILNLRKQKQGYFAPIGSLVKEQGPKLMLIVALLWSVLSNLNKVAIQNSSPTFWAGANTTVLAAALLPIMLYKSPAKFKDISKNITSLIAIGVFEGLTFLCFMKALELTLVAHVIAIKRLSVIISVLLSHFIFQESNIKERATGATIMILGALIITLL